MNSLNVIFHGLWVFVPRRDFIEVIAPSIPFHVYQFGEWLCEEPLAAGMHDFQVQTTTPGTGAFDFSRNLVFGSVTINGDARLRHATLRFPKPHAIISDRTERLADRHFSSPPGTTVKRDNVSEVQVFRYDGVMFSNIRLGQTKIDVNPFGDGADEFANLHFFADSPREESAQEGEQASFIACHQLLNSPVWLRDSPVVQNAAPQARACRPAELLPLSSRIRSAGGFIAVWRTDATAKGQDLLNVGFSVAGRPNCDSVVATEEPLP